MEIYVKVLTAKLLEQLPEFDISLRRQLGDYTIINSTDLQFIGDNQTEQEKIELLGGYAMTTAQARREITKYKQDNE